MSFDELSPLRFQLFHLPHTLFKVRFLLLFHLSLLDFWQIVVILVRECKHIFLGHWNSFPCC
jgi:hypothetical protein